MSQLVYNTVTLSIIKTKEFRQETVYDPSDTDMLFMKFNLTVSAVIAFCPMGISPSNNNDSPTITLNRIRHLLAAPRRSFSMQVNADTLIQVPVVNGIALDRNNGPKPKLLSIMKLTESTFMVDWSIEICINDPCAGTSTSEATSYLCNRWSQSVSYDQRWYATKKTTGYMIVASDMTQSADSLRSLVTPIVDDNFIRQNARYTLTDDGLRLNYEFEDKQQYIMPPSPALKATGKVFVATGEGKSAGCRFLKFSMKLEAFPTAPRAMIPNAAGNIVITTGNKTEMVTQALTMFKNLSDAAGGIAFGYTIGEDGKPKLNTNSDQSKQFLYSGGVGCDIFDNVVEVQIHVMLNPVAKANSLNVNLGFLDQDPYQATTGAAPGTPVLFDPLSLSPGLAPPPYGPALFPGYPGFVGLVAAKFNDPCLQFDERPPAATTEDNTLAGDSDMDDLEGDESSDAPASTITIIQSGSGGTGSRSSPGNLGQTGSDPNSSADPEDQLNYYLDETPGVYTVYKIICTYDTDMHIVSLPSCGVGLTAFPQVANDEMFLTCIWTAEKTGGPPELPPADPIDSNTFLLKKRIEAESIDATEDGAQLTYVYSGRYDYGFADPSIVDILSPIPPFLSNGVAPVVPTDDLADSVWGDATLNTGGDSTLNTGGDSTLTNGPANP
jgi:hypothetical protein